MSRLSVQQRSLNQSFVSHHHYLHPLLPSCNGSGGYQATYLLLSNKNLVIGTPYDEEINVSAYLMLDYCILVPIGIRTGTFLAVQCLNKNKNKKNKLPFKSLMAL